MDYVGLFLAVVDRVTDYLSSGSGVLLYLVSVIIAGYSAA